MRPIFRVSSDESGRIMKVDFLYRDGLVEDITDSVLYGNCRLRLDASNTLVLNIEAFAVTGETIKEAK